MEKIDSTITKKTTVNEQQTQQQQGYLPPSSSSTATTNDRRMIIDVMSIASQDRKEYVETQSQVFQNHATVRHFWNVTEADDGPEWMNCSTTMNEGSVKRYVQQCRKRHNTEFLIQYRYFVPGWVLRKPNPVGWVCAQVRPGSAVAALGKKYSTTPTELLPDFALLVDDDTIFHMDILVNHLQRYIVGATPVTRIWAGCLTTLSRAHFTRYAYFGGAGLVWSKGSLNRLIQRVHCHSPNNLQQQQSQENGQDEDPSSSLFVQQVCQRIDQNLITEKDLFVEGMYVYEFIDKVFHHNPNCFFSDWLLSYFINYYYLSDPVLLVNNDDQESNTSIWHATTPTITTATTTKDGQRNQQQQEPSRIHPLYGDDSVQMFYNDSLPVGSICEQTNIKPATDETCTDETPICHYVGPTMMMMRRSRSHIHIHSLNNNNTIVAG
jgi:hypothetical protein